MYIQSIWTNTGDKVATLSLESFSFSPVTVSYASQSCFQDFQVLARFDFNSNLGGNGTWLIIVGAGA